MTPHSCRHTYVSQMQELDVDLVTIQSSVEHADVDMTKHYLHVQDPVRLGAITKFDEAFFETTSGTFKDHRALQKFLMTSILVRFRCKKLRASKLYAFKNRV